MGAHDRRYQLVADGILRHSCLGSMARYPIKRFYHNEPWIKICLAEAEMRMTNSNLNLIGLVTKSELTSIDLTWVQCVS